MVAELTVRIPQCPQWLPGDTVDIYWDNRSGEIDTDNALFTGIEIWPGQSLQDTQEDEGTIDGGTVEGVAENLATEDDSIEDCGSIDEPAGNVDPTIIDLGPGMYQFRFTSLDVFGNTDYSDVSRWVCTEPHVPTELNYKGLGSIEFTFVPSRSLT